MTTTRVLVLKFEDESGCSVKTVAVGSGEALDLGEKGDADVLLVHSPEDEQDYMDGGHGVSRKAVMHNDFIVVGPEDDPADIKGVGSAAEAFTRIAEADAPFASRAGESGTNTKELQRHPHGRRRAEQDSVDGGIDVDTCIAETKASCEL